MSENTKTGVETKPVTIRIKLSELQVYHTEARRLGLDLSKYLRARLKTSEPSRVSFDAPHLNPLEEDNK